MVEYFTVVDEKDNVIRKASRKECHASNKLIHRGVYIFVINSKNQIFLHKRSMSKDLFPGFWLGSAAGHVRFGESYEEAAKRELKEELGIEAPLKKVCKFKVFSSVEREINVLYVCNYDGKLKLNREEILKGKFVDIEKIREEMEKREKKFTPGFKIAFRNFIKGD